MDLLRDIHYALRAIRRNPVPSAAITLTLALGIGPVTAVFGTVYGVLMRPLPYHDAGQLVRLRQPATDGGAALNFNVPELADYQQRAPSMAGLVEYHTLVFNLIDASGPERVQTGIVSWNYFDLLGIRALHGRTFAADDDEVGAPRVLVLSHEYWMRRFGGDPGVVGRVVEMNQQPHQVVGVLPRIPRYPNSNDDVYMPGSACPFRTPAWLNNRQARALTVFGRVRAGVDVQRARLQLSAAARSLKEEYPASYPPNRSHAITATPVLEELTAGARTTLFVLLGMAAFVLLSVCANVANLTLARVLSRDRDFALMSALGAPRGVIARRMLAESVVLALLGGVLGVALAFATTGILADFAGRFSPRAGDVAVDWPVLLFALVASVGTGLLVGAVPALPGKRDPAQVLREGGQRGSSGGMRMRSALVVGQVGLSFVLLIGAGLMLRSVARLHAVESGFDASSVLTMRIDLDFSRYTQAGRTRAGQAANGPAPIEFWNRLLDELAATPGIRSRGMASAVPFGGGIPQLRFAVREREEDAAANVNWNIVSDGYLQTTGIPLLAGRDFAPSDGQSAPPVALVSELLARQYWGGESPIGSFISVGGANPTWFEVLGVVADVRQGGLDAAPTPQAYLSIRQNPGLGSTLFVRSQGSPQATVPVVRQVIRRVDPNQPVAFVQTLDEVRSNALAPNRVVAVLLGTFAVLALCISAAGIAGVMAYAVSQRTREIGIRLALGATPAEVRWMVLRQALVLVGTGVAVGGASAWLLSGFISGLLFEISRFDPPTYVAVAVVLAAVAVLAAAAPAARSSAVDPLKALRAE